MELKIACNNILEQMADVIRQIPDTGFRKSSEILNGSTLGQHFRHAIEFFECLAKGYESGIICYDKRDHDETIETSTDLALEVIRRVQVFISKADLQKELRLEVSYDPQSDSAIEVSSNMAREIIYNIEHVVHHMALVKIGVKEIVPDLDLPSGFGVAVSTIKYQQSQA